MGRLVFGLGAVCLVAQVIALGALVFAFIPDADLGRHEGWAIRLLFGGFGPFGLALLFAGLAQDRLQKAAERESGSRVWWPVGGLSWSGLARRAPLAARWAGLLGAGLGLAVSLWIGGVSTTEGVAMTTRELRGTLAWALVMYSVAAPLLMSKGAELSGPLTPWPGETDDRAGDAF